jgi:hypothetical protein
LRLGSPILDIGRGRPQQGGIVIEASEPGIALAAEQGAQFARAMAVIDAQRLVRFFLADRADAALPFEHALIVFQRNPVIGLEPATTRRVAVTSARNRLGCRLNAGHGSSHSR